MWKAERDYCETFTPDVLNLISSTALFFRNNITLAPVPHTLLEICFL